MEVVAPIVDDNKTSNGILLFNKRSYDDVQLYMCPNLLQGEGIKRPTTLSVTSQGPIRHTNTGVSDNVWVNRSLGSQSAPSTSVNTKRVGESSPFSSTNRRISTQGKSQRSRIHGTDTGVNVRTRNVLRTTHLNRVNANHVNPLAGNKDEGSSSAHNEDVSPTYAMVLLSSAKDIVELKPQLNKIKEALGRGIIITAYAPFRNASVPDQVSYILNILENFG
ncbi:hypothetical protein Tco_1002278 [Tanacetum coccineum]|uniref:Uncharacterized protein n=1 Tax=Tanacetum coccineum TaxID=301880 RepID=A0ABQ5F668_9ASTR